MPEITSSPQGFPRGIVLLLILAGAIMPGLALPRLLRAKQSAQWPQAKAVITSSQLQVSYYRQRKAFRPLVQYRYRVGDVDYSGSRLSFGRGHAGPSDAWQGVLDAHPVGKTFDVFYDPKDPAFAVLEPGLTGDLGVLYKLDLLVLAAFAAAFLIAVYKFREPASR